MTPTCFSDATCHLKGWLNDRRDPKPQPRSSGAWGQQKMGACGARGSSLGQGWGSERPRHTIFGNWNHEGQTQVPWWQSKILWRWQLFMFWLSLVSSTWVLPLPPCWMASSLNGRVFYLWFLSCFLCARNHFHLSKSNAFFNAPSTREPVRNPPPHRLKILLPRGSACCCVPFLR